MAFAQKILPRLDRLRAIPGKLKLRPKRVFIVNEASDGTYPGDGTIDSSSFELLVGGQPPKVRTLNDEERAIGNLAKGSVRVGRFTPEFQGGGVNLKELIGSYLQGGERLYVRVDGRGDISTRYHITSIEDDRAMHYTFTAEPHQSQE